MHRHSIEVFDQGFIFMYANVSTTTEAKRLFFLFLEGNGEWEGGCGLHAVAMDGNLLQFSSLIY